MKKSALTVRDESRSARSRATRSDVQPGVGGLALASASAAYLARVRVRVRVRVRARARVRGEG